MNRFEPWSFVRIAFLLCLATATASAQTVTTLLTFDLTNGGEPFAGLVQGFDGNLYGTTAVGGTSEKCSQGCGTIFKITSAGKLTTLHSFDDADGSGPENGLIQGSDGNFYGTAYLGGANGDGSVFKITSSGKFTLLHSFDHTDGRNPASALVQGTDGNFYGTTNFGGVNDEGSVFKITSAGNLTTLHSFDGTDGFIPNGTLMQATNGDLYGTTLEGGGSKTCAGGCGTIFKITLAGVFTKEISFDQTDGSSPLAGLIQAKDGNFYGTTNFGGSGSGCSGGCGTVFKMTSAAKLTTLYSFDEKQGAYGPYGGLVPGTDGNLYGTTQDNLVFKITTKGALTTLFTFDYTDGFEPLDGLMQSTGGLFYGTTYQGADGYGTVFSLSMGLGAFVETNPTSGKVGAAVTILGTKLTGATKVLFNGKSAKFKVVSSSEITTTVPAGAATGILKVTTPSGTVDSYVDFRVP
jgi:uncharacterized repeat protein (TIGR03803 family)